MKKDLFAQKATSYEQNRSRVDNVDNIARAVIRSVSLDTSMHLMDFGSGTGLLLERVAPYVRKITAIDISRSMNEQLQAKRDKISCELEMLEVDLETSDISGKFDGIISSMTMHHVRDIDAMFRKFHSLLNDGGFVAIADLNKEDGSFHTEDAGVFHCGFDHDAINKSARAAGFHNIKIDEVSIIHKPQGEFGVFLLTARKNF